MPLFIMIVKLIFEDLYMISEHYLFVISIAIWYF